MKQIQGIVLHSVIKTSVVEPKYSSLVLNVDGRDYTIMDATIPRVDAGEEVILHVSDDGKIAYGLQVVKLKKIVFTFIILAKGPGWSGSSADPQPWEEQEKRKREEVNRYLLKL